jgi:hypothetical protein
MQTVGVEPDVEVLLVANRPVHQEDNNWRERPGRF